MKKENINEIKRTKEEMKVIKRNIIHAFDWIEEQKKLLHRYQQLEREDRNLYSTIMNIIRNYQNMGML